MSRPNLKRAAIQARTQARRQLLQTLYQWQITGEGKEETLRKRIVPNAYDVDEFYFDQAWQYITEHGKDLDALAQPHMKRLPSSLDPVERAALWIGLFELSQRKDIHPTVVINEAVELAKKFGSDEGYKFINGILDNVRKSLEN